MTPSTKPNPLTAFMRQPKIYIKLPSGGNFWPENSINMPENGELAVYSMTARDELTLKIPDALMNGQAVVDVIQNCIPNILDAWQTPSIDLDFILIAIRIATYGEIMNAPVKISDEVEFDYQVDLRIILDNLSSSICWDPAVAISDEITVFVKPLNYSDMTKASIQAFETQRIMQIVNDEKMSEDDKIQTFKTSFQKISNAKIGVIQNSIERIDTIHGSTQEPSHIESFVADMDSAIFNKIQAHLEELGKLNQIKPMKVQVTDEMRDMGITAEFIEIPLTFDQSAFFG
jgi:hypothetical protein